MAEVLEREEQQTKQQTENELDEFMELMQEVAELPEEQRVKVAVFSQGVLATANLQKRGD